MLVCHFRYFYTLEFNNWEHFQLYYILIMTWQCTILDNKEDDICNLHRDLGDMMHDVTVLGQISTLISSLKMSHEVSRPISLSRSRSLSLSLSLSLRTLCQMGTILYKIFKIFLHNNSCYLKKLNNHDNDDTHLLFYQQNIPTVYDEMNYI